VIGSLDDFSFEKRDKSSLKRLRFLSVYQDDRDDNYSCRTCWSRHLCGGECYEVRDSLGEKFAAMKGPSCDLRRHLFKLGLKLFYAIRNSPNFHRLMEMNAVLKHKATDIRSDSIAPLSK